MLADMAWGTCGALSASESILCVSKWAVAQSGGNLVKSASVPALRRLGKQVAVGSLPAAIALGCGAGDFCALRTDHPCGDPVMRVLRAERIRRKARSRTLLHARYGAVQKRAKKRRGRAEGKKSV